MGVVDAAAQLGRGRTGRRRVNLAAVTPRRGPTLLGFIALGLFWGAWASVLPSVQDATGASKGALGLALLFVTLGAIPAMLFVGGPTVERFGPRAVAVTCAAFAAVSTLPGLAGSLPTLMLALAATGAASGALDVGINANAARIESETGARLMPLAHGLYSVGILVGAVGSRHRPKPGSGPRGDPAGRRRSRSRRRRSCSRPIGRRPSRQARRAVCGSSTPSS